jgi:hypothetical protein
VIVAVQFVRHCVSLDEVNMNLIAKSLAFVAAATLTSVSHADTYRYFFGYGDANLAALNGAAVGDAVPNNRNLIVPTSASPVTSYTLQVWVEKLTGSSNTLQSGTSTHISFDRGVAANIGQVSASTFQHKKVKPFGANANAAVSNRASFAAYTNTGAALGMNGTLGNNSQYRGEYQAGQAATLRMTGYGIQSMFLAADGQPAHFKLSLGSKYRLMDVSFVSGLVGGEVYGDNGDETGIVATTSDASSSETSAGARSYVASVGTSYNGNTGQRLIVQGVPEPGSLLALAAGLLVVLRSKRK